MSTQFDHSGPHSVPHSAPTSTTPTNRINQSAADDHVADGHRAGTRPAAQSIKGKVRALFEQHLMRSMQSMQDEYSSLDVLTKDQQARLVDVMELALTRPTPDLWAMCCTLLRTVAPQMEQSVIWQDWMRLLQTGVSQSNHKGDVTAEAHFLLLLGFEEQRLGQWDSAEQRYRRSVTLFGQESMSDQYAVALGRLGYLKYIQGSHEEALDYATKSLDQLVAGDFECHRGYFIRGVVALAQEETGDAIRWIDRSLEICRAHQSERLTAMRYRTLGWAYTEHGDLVKGEQYLRKAIHMFSQMGDETEYALAKMNLGIVFAIGNKPMQALDLYAEAAPVFRRLHDQLNLALLHNNQGLSYKALKRWDDAVYAYEAGIALQRELGNKRLLVGVLKNLGVLYREIEQKEKAIATFESALDVLQQVEDTSVIEVLSQGIYRELAQVA